jgi:hypothetical protein
MGNRAVPATIIGVAVVLGLLLPSAAMGAVPPPGPGSAVVTVRTGGDRVGEDQVGVLPGVQLGLFATETATAPEALCTADADGDCSFAVPAGLIGTAPWVGSVSVPAGWYANPVLRTGPASGSSSNASAYRFQVPAIQTGTTYRSSRDFMYSTSNALPTRSNGVWQQSRTNPQLPRQCGSDVAVVLDLSASVGSALPQLKAAADAFADALVGTPSRLAVFSFSRQSPSTETASGTVDENRPDLVSVSTQAGADAFTAQYAGWGLGSGTNWDQALQQVAAADEHYDAVIMLTDGNPDRWGATHGDGSNTHFTDVEAAVFSANTVKSEGTRIVSFGVGSGVAGISGLNLAAISGPTPFDGSNAATADSFQTADYAGAAEQLREVALAGCTGSLSVVKQIVPPDTSGDDVTGATPAGAGWTFDAEPGSTGTTVGAPSATTTDDGTGSVSFALTPPTGSSTSVVDVEERQQPGYSLVARAGQNATCTNLTSGGRVPVTSSGTTGFRVAVPSAAAVSCTVYNRPAAAASVTVGKQWTIDGRPYADEEQPTWARAGLTLTGPGSARPTAQPFGAQREGYLSGDIVGIDERTDLTREGCTLESSTLRDASGTVVDGSVPAEVTLAGGSNVFTLQNVVACPSAPTSTPTPTAGAADPGTSNGDRPGPGRPASTGDLAFTGLDGPALLGAAGAAAGGVALCTVLLLRLRRRSALRGD